ncbi:MAG: hypothetical protein IH945_11940 [Armatimonadetes bacterium]|nr:hypothetical protein [Armatimonadota bacterium]
MIDLDSPEEFYQRRMRSVDRRRLLQPRSSSEMIDLATRLYHKLAWPILRLTLPSMCLLYAGLIFFQGFVLPGLLTTSNPDDTMVQFQELMVVYAVALFVALPVVVIALGHSVGLATRMISDYVMEQKINVDAAVRAARTGARTMVRLMLQIFLRSGVVLIVSGGFMMVSAYYEQSGGASVFGDVAAGFAVFGLIVGVIVVPIVMSSLALAPAVATVEGVGARVAMRRSKELMRKSRHISSGYDTIASIWLVAFLVALLLWGGFYASYSMVGAAGFVDDLAGGSVLWALAGETLKTLPTFAAMWTLVPFVTCCLTVLYFDRRVRLEALDIETMAHDVLRGSEEADLRL